MGSQTVDWLATARLLRRTGFGTTGAAVDAAVRRGRTSTIQALLTASASDDPGAKATPTPSFESVERLMKSASKDERKARNAQLRRQLITLSGWWLQRMAAAQQPFPEKLTFLWHNHFATSASKVRNASALLQQNETLRRLGRGNFRTLALAMLTDPAMLRWLDGEKNVKGAANENLSREFMELFTLGHGDAYTETDVREGARALTGWRIRPNGEAMLKPRLHDDGTKTILGVTGPLDHVGFCDAILAQPGSARYVATRMWGQLVSGSPPSPTTLDSLVAAYGAKRDLTALLREMLTTPSFNTAAGSVVVTPVEWMVGAARSLRVPLDSAVTVRRILLVLRQLGQVPFYPPSVGGWPSGTAWLSTAAADLRMRTATSLVRAGDLDSVASAAHTQRVDAAGYVLGIGAWSKSSRAALNDASGDVRQLMVLALNTPENLAS